MVKKLFLIGLVVFVVCLPYTFFPDRPNWYQLDWAITVPVEAVVEAGYLAGSPCASQPVSLVCPDRSYGWQQREHDGGLSPEAGSASGGGDSGSSGGDAGSAGGDSGTGGK